MSIPTLNVPSLSVPRLNVPRLYVPKLEVPTLGSSPYYRYNKKKTRRHVVDLGDIILGHPITGTKQLRHTLEDAGHADLIYVPILNRIAGVLIAADERFIQPTLRGDIFETLINGLESWGNSVDILANPVKSLMPWAGGGSITDLYKSMGWIDSEYRETYQWDTGNFIVDVIGEMASDPVNWATAITGGLQVPALDVATEAVQKTLMKRTGKALIGAGVDAAKDTAFVRNLVKTVAATTADQDDKLVKILFNRINANREALENSIKNLPVGSSIRKIKEARLRSITNLIDNDLNGNLTDLIYEIRMDKGYKYYNSIRRAKVWADKVNDTLINAGLVMAPQFGVGKVLFKSLTPRGQDLKNAWVKHLKSVPLNNMYPEKADAVFKSTLIDLSERHRIKHKAIFDKFENIFYRYGLDTNKLQMMYLEIYHDIPKAKRTKTEAVKRLKHRLAERIPALKSLFNDGTYKNISKANKEFNRRLGAAELSKEQFEKMYQEFSRAKQGLPITPDDFDALTDVLDELAVEVDDLGEELNRRIIEMVRLDFEDFLKANNLVDDTTNLLLYVTNKYMRIGSRQYGLAELEQFIAALNQQNPEHFAKIMAILNYVGITVDSAKQMQEMVELTTAYNKVVKQLETVNKSFSNLHRVIKEQVDDLLDADSNNLTKVLNALDDLITDLTNVLGTQGTISEEEVKRIVRRVNAFIKLLDAVHFPNTLGTMDELLKQRQLIISKNVVLKKLNKVPGRADLTQQLSELIMRNKTGSLPQTYSAIELKRIFKEFKYNAPKVNVEDLSELRSKALGHAEKLTEIDADMSGAKKYQADFMEKLSKIIRDYQEYLNDFSVTTDNNFDPQLRSTRIKEIQKQLNNLTEPDKKLHYKDWLEARAEKTRLEQELEALTSNHDTKFGVYTELDSLDRYAASINEEGYYSELPSRKLFSDIFEFEMTDDYDISAFDEMHTILKDRVKHWRAHMDEQPLSNKAKQFINDLNELFVDTKVQQVYTDQVARLIDENHRLYYLMLRKSNNVSMLFNAIVNAVGDGGSWSDVDKLWFERLMDPSNPTLREEYIAIAKILREANYDYIAQDIEYILAALQQLQAYAAIEQKLRAKYSSKLSKEQCNYIINLVYNGLINSKLEGASAYTKGDVARFMAAYKKQYFIKQHTFVEQSALDIARKNDWIDVEVNAGTLSKPPQQFDDELDQAMYEAWEAMQPKQLVTEELYLANFERELMKDVEEAFTTYLATMNYIARTTGTNVMVAPIVNYGHMMNRMREITHDFMELVTVLQDPNQRASFETFVKNIGGSQYTPEMADYYKSLNQAESFFDQAEIQGQGISVNKLSPRVNETGLFDIFKNSFYDIGKINTDLASKEEVVYVLDKIERTVSKRGLVSDYITYQELDDYVKSTGVADNIYDYSLANDFGLAFKKYRVPSVFQDSSLYNNALDTTGVYRQFIEWYRRALALLDNSDKGRVLNKYYIEQVRHALIEAYTKSDAPYAPLNPELYFKDLSDIDIRAWDLVTRYHSLNSHVASRYTESIEKRLTKSEITQEVVAKQGFGIGERIDYNEDTNALYRSLEQELNASGFTEESAFKSDIDSADYTQFSNIREYASAVFKKWVKDPDTLLDNSYNISEHIQNNVDAWERVRFLDSLTKNNTTVNSLGLSDSELELLKLQGIKPDSYLNDRKVLRYITKERSDVITNSFKTWSAQDIRSYIDHDTQGMGFLIYVDEFNTRDFSHKPYLHNRFTAEELKAAGLSIHQPFKDAPHVFVIRKLKTATDTVERTHSYFKPNYIFKKEQEQITNLFKSNLHYYEYGGNNIHPEIFTGEVIDLDTFQTLVDSDELIEILGDDAERKLYSKTFAKGVNNNFVLNTFIIGSPDATNELYSCFAQRFQDLNKSIPYHSMEAPRLLYSSSHTVITRANNIIKYLELFFNQDYYLGSMHFVEAFKSATDADISNFFKRGNFVAMVAKEAKDGSPAIYKFEVYNRKTLNEAIKQGAVAVPYEIYRNAVLTVNKKQLNAKLFNIYRRTIVATFKTIYLTTAGFLMRNELDSAVYKNSASTGGVPQIYEMIKYQKRAWDMWKRYSDIQKAIIDGTKSTPGSLGTINRRAIRAHLSTLSKTDQQLYQLVDIFVNSSASGGYSKALEDMLLEYNMVAGTDLAPWEKMYHEQILNAEWNPTRWVMDLNSQIEQTARLALFLKVVDESGDYAKAIKEVITAHFDYSLKEPGMGLIEDIFWFSTFPINNMAYYLNEGMSRNPDMFKLYMDMLEQSWNNNDITWDDVRRNEYYAYNAMRGNLRFKFNGRNIVLKTGGSVMDYLNILASPFKEAKERLNPFASVLLGIEPMSELNPLAGTINRVTQLGVGPGKSLIPSVYTELYPNRPYRRSARTYANTYRKTWYPKSRKIRRPSNLAYMRYKFMTNAYYFGKGPNRRLWLTSTTAIEPNWYKYNYRRYKSQARLNRMTRKLNLPLYSKPK